MICIVGKEDCLERETGIWVGNCSTWMEDWLSQGGLEQTRD